MGRIHGSGSKRFCPHAVAAVLLCVFAPAEVCNASGTSPLVIVYSDEHPPISDVTVVATNPHRDAAMVITSVEFEGQLPELRYFYHSVYGEIRKEGENYVHHKMAQMLSHTAVSTCFLLPGQSASWKRPIRVLETGYRVHVEWWEIPVEDVDKSVWFETPRQEDGGWPLYVPLSQDRESLYSNMAVAKGRVPNVILEGSFPDRTADVNVPHVISRSTPGRPSSSDVPPGSVRVSLGSISEWVIVTTDKVTFPKFNSRLQRHESFAPDVSPTAIDFISLCLQKTEKVIPCILDPNTFNDLVEVKRPSRNMYYEPGITRVPATIFRKILERAQERNLPVRLKVIDPNALYRQYVIVCGVEIDNRGRQPNPPEPQVRQPGADRPGS